MAKEALNSVSGKERRRKNSLLLSHPPAAAPAEGADPAAIPASPIATRKPPTVLEQELEGWVYKKPKRAPAGVLANLTFNKRWMKQNGRMLLIFEKQGLDQPKESLDLDTVLVVEALETPSFGFSILLPDKNLIFKTDSQSQQATWVDSLRATIYTTETPPPSTPLQSEVKGQGSEELIRPPAAGDSAVVETAPTGDSTALPTIPVLVAPLVIPALSSSGSPGPSPANSPRGTAPDQLPSTPESAPAATATTASAPSPANSPRGPPAGEAPIDEPKPSSPPKEGSLITQRRPSLLPKPTLSPQMQRRLSIGPKQPIQAQPKAPLKPSSSGTGHIIVILILAIILAVIVLAGLLLLREPQLLEQLFPGFKIQPKSFWNKVQALFE